MTSEPEPTPTDTDTEQLSAIWTPREQFDSDLATCDQQIVEALEMADDYSLDRDDLWWHFNHLQKRRHALIKDYYSRYERREFKAARDAAERTRNRYTLMFRIRQLEFEIYRTQEKRATLHRWALIGRLRNTRTTRNLEESLELYRAQLKPGSRYVPLDEKIFGPTS